MKALNYIKPKSFAKFTVLSAIPMVILMILFGLFFTIANGSILVPLLIIVIAAVMVLLGSYVQSLILAFVYNYLAKKFGAIKFEYKKSELSKVDVASNIKMNLMLNSFFYAIGFVLTLFLVLILNPNAIGESLGGILIDFIADVLFGALIAMVGIFLYNFVAKKYVAIKFSYESGKISHLDFSSYVKNNVIMHAFLGIVVAAFALFAYLGGSLFIGSFNVVLAFVVLMGSYIAWILLVFIITAFACWYTNLILRWSKGVEVKIK